MNKEKRVVVLTGASASWKTSLQKELMKRGWATPINYTTRTPRSDDEKDDYVFLTEKQFLFKLNKGDFLEWTYSYWQYYGISSILKGDRIVLVLDPAGREQVRKALAYEENYKLDTYFLNISKKLAVERMEKRGDEDGKIASRALDWKIYVPAKGDVILDWKDDTDLLANVIE